MVGITMLPSLEFVSIFATAVYHNALYHMIIHLAWKWVVIIYFETKNVYSFHFQFECYLYMADFNHVWECNVYSCLPSLSYIAGKPALQQRRVPNWDQLSCRIPIQATKDKLQDQDIPPQYRREGSGVLADNKCRELETCY